MTTERGIDEFLYLNNGLTITCLSKTPPKGGLVTIHRPQIVNGLQTVTTLSEAYDSLSPKMQSYFDENCYLIVRLYDQQAISDVAKLVKATNNQNKMELRNLKSNDKGQITFEQLFARLGWFYERKDFAWQAFERDERQWGTLRGFTANDFKVRGRTGRPAVRRVDNEEVGQTWLSFCGYVDDAAQRRRLIFDEEKGSHYERIFNQRMIRHAFDYDYKFHSPRIDEETHFSAPAPEALLLANLTYKLAKNIVPSASAHKKLMIEKLQLQHLTSEEQDDALKSKIDYISGLSMASGPFLFSEMCGFVLFRAFGRDLHAFSGDLLRKTDISVIFNDLDFDSFLAPLAERNTKKGLLGSLWLLFHWLITDLVEDDRWRQNFFLESSKPRIMYRDSTRKQILRRLENLDERCSSKALHYEWSSDLFDGKGIFNGVRLSVREGARHRHP